MKKLLSGALAAAMRLSLTACGGGGGGSSSQADIPVVNLPAINEITLGQDYKDLTAEIKVLTNRTDVVDTVYAGYVKEFNQMYPNITVTYDAVTDYEESLRLRLTTGDWGDICFIPTAVQKSQMGDYFAPLGDFATLDGIYNFVSDKTFNNTVYGLANGGVARGIIYNKKVWEQAGYSGD